MNTTPIINWLFKATAVSTLTATFAISMPSRAAGFDPQPDPPGKFGMVGLTRGQTARLNVVNIGNPNESSCSVELSFLDSLGNTVGIQPCIIPPGEADFLDLNAEALGGPDTFGRFQIRATVALGGSSTRPREARACANNLRLTLEVFETATGATTVFIGDPND